MMMLESLQDVLAAFLAHEGFSGVRRLERCRNTPIISDTSRIDLASLDVMLGEEDGIRLCRSYVSEQDVPIISCPLTLSSDQQRASGHQVGADDYIAKAFQSRIVAGPQTKLFFVVAMAISFAEYHRLGYCRISFQWLAIFRKKR